MTPKAAEAIERQNFTVVQALRGFAAMWVVLFHAREGGHLPTLYASLPSWFRTTVFDQGHNGVPIFFALSGFVIAHSVRELSPSVRNFGRFALKRIIRLDPPYWASIVFVLAMGLLSSIVKHERMTWPTFGAISSHLFYLQAFLNYPQINTVYWTLAYEVQFYLFFVGLITAAGLLYGEKTWAKEAAWWIMYGLAITALFVPHDKMMPGLFVNLWPAFFIGALAYRAVEAKTRQIALLTLAGLMLAFGHESIEFWIYSTITALLLLFFLRTGAIYTSLNWKWLQFLGAISYSLYLIHNPITGAAGFVGHKFLGTGVIADIGVLIGIAIASVVGSTGFWWLVERKAQAWSKHVRLKTASNPSI